MSSSGVLDFFELLGLSQVTEDDRFICRICRIPNTDFLNDVLFDVAFPKIFCPCFGSARVGFRVQQCSIFPEVIKNFFVELGGFPKINFFDTAQFAECIGWSKMSDNVPFLSEIIQDVDRYPQFSEGFKRSDE